VRDGGGIPSPSPFRRFLGFSVLWKLEQSPSVPHLSSPFSQVQCRVPVPFCGAAGMSFFFPQPSIFSPFGPPLVDVERDRTLTFLFRFFFRKYGTPLRLLYLLPVSSLFFTWVRQAERSYTLSRFFSDFFLLQERPYPLVAITGDLVVTQRPWPLFLMVERFFSPTPCSTVLTAQGPTFLFSPAVAHWVALGDVALRERTCRLRTQPFFASNLRPLV